MGIELRECPICKVGGLKGDLSSCPQCQSDLEIFRLIREVSNMSAVNSTGHSAPQTESTKHPSPPSIPGFFKYALAGLILMNLVQSATLLHLFSELKSTVVLEAQPPKSNFGAPSADFESSFLAIHRALIGSLDKSLDLLAKERAERTKALSSLEAEKAISRPVSAAALQQDLGTESLE